MKTSRTTRTVLASVLALAPLSAAVAAAPSGEAALSAAYAAQRDGLSAALKAADSARAELPAAEAAPVSPAHWQELLAKVRAAGTHMPADQNMPENYGLADLRGPADHAHVANYINSWGFSDSKGVFQPSEVTLVSEQWTIPADGNWHIDQWLFRLDVDGSVSARAHIVLVETRDGQVLGDDAENLKDGDSRIAAKYDALLNLWRGYQPHPKAELLGSSGASQTLVGPRAALRRLH